MKKTFNLSKENSRLFLLYFYSAMRSPKHGLIQANGSSHFENNNYVSEQDITFEIEEEKVFVSWKIIQTHDGRLLSIESLNQINTERELLLQDFIHVILIRTLEEETNKYFKRLFFRTIAGCNLPGEYWLPGFRFAPLFPDDDSGLVNAERIVVIDQNVAAIDNRHADEVAQALASQYSAYLSFILNTPLEIPNHQNIYFLNEENEKYEMIRKSTQLYVNSGISSMPKKGEICNLANFEDSVFNPTRPTNEYLVCPKETRKILRGIRDAERIVQDCFLHCCLLYQLGGIAGRRFPTVKLSYEIAAVESIVKRKGTDHGGFTDFMNSYAKEDRELYDFLFGRIRSAHWHAGSLSFGELDFSDPLITGPERHLSFNIKRISHERIRLAILNWLDEKVEFTKNAN